MRDDEQFASKLWSAELIPQVSLSQADVFVQDALLLICQRLAHEVHNAQKSETFKTIKYDECFCFRDNTVVMPLEPNGHTSNGTQAARNTNKKHAMRKWAPRKY